MSENLFGLTVAADKGLDDLQCQRLLSENRRYQEVMLQYRCALKALESRLEILNEEFSLQHDCNPIESMKSRLKSPSSIMNKMHKRGLPLNFPTMQANIMDVAGVRVICSFEEDVFFTIAMDFWASLEHTIRYKKNLPINTDIFHPLRVFKSRQRKRKTSLLSCLHKTRRESMSPAKKPDYVGLFCCPNGDFVCAETQM
ncbi:MAG: GTP pyrophosphokinase family protein [Firmicutes bacterium]|nr:GTP pyrophosphokinase family protein [Bacillota bacterium]